MAFPVGWDRSAPIVVDATQVSGTGVISDFPIFLTEANLPSEMFDSDGSYPALNGGGDIRFTSDSAGTTRLPCQIVEFTTDPDPANGKATIYVKSSLDGSSDTTIYVWYSKAGETQPAVSDTYGSQNVWDSTFAAAFVTPQYGGSLSDSTANARNLVGGVVSDRKQIYLAGYNDTNTSIPDVNQGITYGEDGYWYATTSTALYKYASLDGSAVASNTDPNGDVSVNVNHCGAPDYYNGYLYVPICKWNSCSDFGYAHIAVFDATDLSYVTSYDISAQGVDCAGINIDPDAGTNGIIYVVDFCASEYIWKYDLSDGTYLGAITLDASSTTFFQGIEWFQGLFIVSCTISKASLVAYKLDGTYCGLIYSNDSHIPGNCQSVCAKDGDLYWLDGSTPKKLYKFKANWKTDRRIVIGQANSAYQMTYTLPDTGMISVFLDPKRYYDSNKIWDNSGDANYWEAWFDSSTQVQARANGTAVYYPLASGSENAFLQCAFAWEKSGSNVNQELFVDGASRDTNVVAWGDPGTYHYLNGGNSGNTTGEAYFKRFTISTAIRSDDWITTEYNNVLDNTSFATAGTPETPSGGTLPTITSSLDATQGANSLFGVSLVGTAAVVNQQQELNTISAYCNPIGSWQLIDSQESDGVSITAASSLASKLTLQQDDNSVSCSATNATHCAMSKQTGWDVSVAHASLSTNAVLSGSQSSDSVTGRLLFVSDATFALDASQESDSVYSKISGGTTNENYYFLLNRRDKDRKREPMPV